MKVYDCDNDEQFKTLNTLYEEKEMLKNNKIQSFSPDSLEEAKNRGYKPVQSFKDHFFIPFVEFLEISLLDRNK